MLSSPTTFRRVAAGTVLVAAPLLFLIGDVRGRGVTLAHIGGGLASRAQ